MRSVRWLVSLVLFVSSRAVRAQTRSIPDETGGERFPEADNENTVATNNAESSSSKLHHDLARRMRVLSDEDEIHVIIGFRNAGGKESVSSRQRNGTLCREFQSISAVATAISVAALHELDIDENIAYIEPDLIAVAAASEAIPNSIFNIQGLPGYARPQGVVTTSAPSSGACSDPNSFKIAVIDSGADISHYDLPCLTRPDNCRGRDFASTSGGDFWHRPLYAHGTHVLGTIGALGNNNLGITSMIPDGNVCYLIGKALDSQGVGYVSDILSAVEWAAQEGAKVINLSLVISSYLLSTNQFFDDLYYNQNRIVVAAAGNYGDSGQYLYPASYNSVISVVAVDEDLQRSSFSQTNNLVDLAAFGRNVISTVPLYSEDSLPLAVLTMQTDGTTRVGLYSERSTTFSAPTGGQLILCPKHGRPAPCPGPGGHFCLMERSRRQGYEGQARRCQAGGGIGLIVYQTSADQSFGGKLSRNSQVTIPVVAIDNETGRALRDSYQGSSVSVETHNFGYGYKAGTSMAAPAVAGAVGSIWRGCPTCTNQQIESCLKKTARDLGPYGFDNWYGHGLVQTEPALRCLQSTEMCC